MNKCLAAFVFKNQINGSTNIYPECSSSQSVSLEGATEDSLSSGKSTERKMTRDNEYFPKKIK